MSIKPARRMEQAIFREIVKMAYEMEAAEEQEKYLVDRVRIAAMVEARVSRDNKFRTWVKIAEEKMDLFHDNGNRYMEYILSTTSLSIRYFSRITREFLCLPVDAPEPYPNSYVIYFEYRDGKWERDDVSLSIGRIEFNPKTRAKNRAELYEKICEEATRLVKTLPREAQLKVARQHYKEAKRYIRGYELTQRESNYEDYYLAKKVYER